MPSGLWSPFQSLFHRSRIDSELDEELRAHIQSRADDLERSGLGRAEAERRARIEFGGVERCKEECRDALGTRFLESLVQDVRFGLRMLRKSPGFTAVAIITLALGIGANTAIFSAVNGIWLAPLPYAHPSSLVQIEGSGHSPGGFPMQGLSLPDIRDIRAHCPALGQIAAYNYYGGGTMLGGSIPDDVISPPVSGNFFTMLGVRPLLGRPILPSNTKPGNDRVVVLSYGLWKKDFGGDPGVVGKTITLSKQPYTVIGVMPPRFSLGLQIPERGLWTPLVPPTGPAAGRDFHFYLAVARLRHGATLAAANVQLKTLATRLATAYPTADKGWQLSAKSAKNALLGDELPMELLILFTAVGLVLLIACVNVSGMLLARSWTRHREVAIREALGATRRRVVWQFLVESLMLSLAGGALGLLLAFWLVSVLRAIAPPNTPRIDQLRLDAGVLWFTLGISILTGILFGLAPALQASGKKVGATLKQGVGGLFEGFSGRGPRRLRGALVIFEIALAVVLATGATLVARSLQKLMAVPLGYRTEHVLMLQASLMNSACDYQHQKLCQQAASEILQRVQGISGVEGAAEALASPLYGMYLSTAVIATPAGPESLTGPTAYNVATPGYFGAMGIPLLAGRDFNGSDTSNSQHVAIVNRAFANRYFHGASPLGQRIAMNTFGKAQPQWMEVVGEAGDTRDPMNPMTGTKPQPEYYMPATQNSQIGMSPNFLVRTATNPLAIAAAVKQQIWSVDKDAPVSEGQTMAQIVAVHQAAPRFRTALLGAFGLLGVLLAIVGIYGVISYAVSRRTREIGLRMALGAQPGDALRMVIREGMVLAAIGIVIGVGGALALTRFLRSFLFEIKPNDPATFAGVAIALALAALVACYIPARRAMRVDPMAALRHE